MDITEAKKTRDLNRVKYDRAIAKLNKMTERRQTSTISKAIKQVENTWKELENAQDLYTLELNNTGNHKEVESLKEKFADLECDMEQTINDAEKIKATEMDDTEEDEPKIPKKGLLNKCDMNQAIDDAEQMLATETDDADEEKQKIPKKGVLNKMVSAGRAVIVSTVENIGKTVRDTLANIPVSKKQYQQFQVALKDQLISKWDEQSETKFFQGVEIAKYKQFLDNFQRSTGIDDKVRADFENMDFTDRIDDKVKTFRCEGTDTSGKYGMYMAIKRPQEKKIDIAYAMYTFTATFVSSSKSKTNEYNIWHAEPANKGLFGKGLYRLTKPVVEDVLTGKLMEPNRFFRKADMDELAENFIVTKALTAFAHKGFIPKVTYIEDQEEKPKIEEITDES